MLLSWSLQRVVLKHVGNMDSRKSELPVTEIIWKGTCGGMNEISSSLHPLYGYLFCCEDFSGTVYYENTVLKFDLRITLMENLPSHSVNSQVSSFGHQNLYPVVQNSAAGVGLLVIPI